MLLSDIASVAGIVVWPVVVIICFIAACAAAREVSHHYFESATLLRRRRFRAQDWAPYEPLNITETVATVVAAAVAVRYIKRQEHAMSRNRVTDEERRAVEDRSHDLDFQQMRRIVRRMTASIRSGEARWLRGKLILWVHRVEAEDEFERSALNSLGGTVQFFDDNESVLKALAGKGDAKRDRFDIIVTNKRHFLTPAGRRGERAQPELRAGDELLSKLRDGRNQIPVIVYSRSLEPGDEQRFLGPLQARACVANPEDFIHAVLMAAKPEDDDVPLVSKPSPQPVAAERKTMLGRLNRRMRRSGKQ